MCACLHPYILCRLLFSLFTIQYLCSYDITSCLVPEGKLEYLMFTSILFCLLKLLIIFSSYFTCATFMQTRGTACHLIAYRLIPSGVSSSSLMKYFSELWITFDFSNSRYSFAGDSGVDYTTNNTNIEVDALKRTSSAHTLAQWDLKILPAQISCCTS